MKNEIKYDLSPVSEDPQGLFWKLQAVGWSIFLIVIFAYNANELVNQWFTLILAFIVSGVGFGLTSGYRIFLKKNKWTNRSPRKLVIPIFLSNLIISIIWTVVFFVVTWVLHYISSDPSVLKLPVILGIFVNTFLIICLWSTIYFSYHFFEIGQKARIDRYQMESASKSAQLNVLKSQINPHFMFNALNNIRALMREDTERSREMITHLSDILRYSMNISSKAEVTLEEELTIVRNFLELCHIQFEDRLDYEIETDISALKTTVPPMIIQILVENSIKHGISPLKEGGKVLVDAHLKDKVLTITVKNNGQWNTHNTKTKGSGIGIPNIKTRLSLLYGNDAKLEVNHKDNWITARIEIKKKEYESINS